MSPTVETNSGEKIEDIEPRSTDNTVGLLVAEYGELFEAEALFDLQRLRAAIIAYEQEYDDTDAYIKIQEHPEGEEYVITLQPRDESAQAIALASRIPHDEDGGSA